MRSRERGLGTGWFFLWEQVAAISGYLFFISKACKETGFIIPWGERASAPKRDKSTAPAHTTIHSAHVGLLYSRKKWAICWAAAVETLFRRARHCNSPRSFAVTCTEEGKAETTPYKHASQTTPYKLLAHDRWKSSLACMEILPWKLYRNVVCRKMAWHQRERELGNVPSNATHLPCLSASLPHSSLCLLSAPWEVKGNVPVLYIYPYSLASDEISCCLWELTCLWFS